jgi:hypothetical protein
MRVLLVQSASNGTQSVRQCVECVRAWASCTAHTLVSKSYSAAEGLWSYRPCTLPSCGAGTGVFPARAVPHRGAASVPEHPGRPAGGSHCQRRGGVPLVRPRTALYGGALCRWGGALGCGYATCVGGVQGAAVCAEMVAYGGWGGVWVRGSVAMRRVLACKALRCVRRRLLTEGGGGRSDKGNSVTRFALCLACGVNMVLLCALPLWQACKRILGLRIRSRFGGKLCVEYEGRYGPHVRSIVPAPTTGC